MLVKLDRATMFNSLESRLPFLDKNIQNFSQLVPQDFKMNQNYGKIILKKTLEKYIPSHLIYKPKMGFSVPIDNWLRVELKDFALETLNKKSLFEQNNLNYNTNLSHKSPVFFGILNVNLFLHYSSVRNPTSRNSYVILHRHNIF